MACKLLSSVFRPTRSSPKMAEIPPSERELWCAFSDDIKRSFSVSAIVGVNSIDTIRQQICNMKPTLVRWELDVYSPVRPINGVIRLDDLILLDPRQRISSAFPSSKDPQLDLIIVVVESLPGQVEKSPISVVFESLPGQDQSVAAKVDQSPTLAPQNMICARSDTVSVLAQMVVNEKIVHVRGTPASGKSTLSLLLRDYFRRNGRKVFLIGGWRQCLDDLDGANAWAKFGKALRLKYRNVHKIDEFFADGTVIIVDEAQGTYRDITFWDDIVKPIRGDTGFRIKLCLFCSYGSPAAGTDYDPIDGRTPVDFAARQTVSLTPFAAEGLQQIGLFYARHEFDDVITKLCSSDPVLQYSVEQDARDYIFNLTNGHPGAVISIVQYIFNVFRSVTKSKVKSAITRRDVVEVLAKDHEVFKNIKGTPVGRSFPFQTKLTSQAKDVLCRILEEGSVPFDISDEPDPGLRVCYKNGWIHRALCDVENEQKGYVAVLTSRLHEKYVEYLIGTSPSPFPANEFPDIRILCIRILQNFSAKRLRHCLIGKMSTAARLRPVEAQYQDEFYRAFNKVVGRGVPISSEWSPGGNGRVDFWIPEKYWGIELLRDHSNLHEHCDRFQKGGRYYPWVVNGMIKDYIVIDCATSFPRNDHHDPKLIRAVFTEDYSQLSLLDHKNNVIQNPIVLIN